MVIKEIIGIYLGKEALHYCCAVRTLASWQLAMPGSAMDASGMLQGSALSVLREFLQRFSPKNGRRIYLALPRSRFFVRDVQLPPVALEDALMSVQNMLPVTCHLPLDEIFYDIYLCRLSDGRVSALVIYALRKEIYPFLEIFREIGHEKSLAALFPVSLGIGSWLSLQKYPMPMGLVFAPENTAGELAVFQQSGCIFSTGWQNVPDAQSVSQRIESACAAFHLAEDSIYSIGHAEGCLPLLDPLINKLPWLPSILQNPAAAAVSVAVDSQQHILLNGDTPRIKLFRLWKLFVPLILVLVLVISVWALILNREIEHDGASVTAVKAEIQQLQQQIRPLEKMRDAINKTQSLSADIDDFMRLRPRLFSCFNEIARLVPEGTWFSRANFQGAELNLHGQSREALKVIESLRSSPLFEQVKLVGSVSRNPAGTEQFSLVIRLKDTETTP